MAIDDSPVRRSIECFRKRALKFPILAIWIPNCMCVWCNARRKASCPRRLAGRSSPPASRFRKGQFRAIHFTLQWGFSRNPTCWGLFRGGCVRRRSHVTFCRRSPLRNRYRLSRPRCSRVLIYRSLRSPRPGQRRSLRLRGRWSQRTGSRWSCCHRQGERASHDTPRGYCNRLWNHGTITSRNMRPSDQS